MASLNMISPNPRLDLKRYKYSEPDAHYNGIRVISFGDIEIKNLLPDDLTLHYLSEKTNIDTIVNLRIYVTSNINFSSNNTPLPLVSIVVPTHNTERFIELTLKSISEQDYTSFELLLVDDGSEDNTRTLIKKFLSAHHNIIKAKYVELPNIGNPAAIRNFALFNLISPDSSFVTFMDDDDLYSSPSSLGDLVKPLITNQDYSFSYGGYDFIDENGRLIARPAMLKKTSSSGWKWREHGKLTWSNIAKYRVGVYHLQSLCVRLPSPVMPYYRTGSDGGYFARIIRKASELRAGELTGIWHVPEVIFHYRKRAKSISVNHLISTQNHAGSSHSESISDSVPKFFCDSGMPEKYITSANLSEYKIRKALPKIYNTLYLIKSRQIGFLVAISNIRNIIKQRNVGIARLCLVLVQDLINSTKLRDFLYLRLKR